MAYGYWKTAAIDKEAVFHLFFRKPPFSGGFAVAAGLEYVIDFIEAFKVTDDDGKYLMSLTGRDRKPLFEQEFVDYLKQFKFSGDIDAVPEGTVVFPQEPLIRLRGTILECQILETVLLNIINFQTLIATKAARIREAAGDKPIIEFGLRRAHGFDGAITATRASFIGGVDGTSNVLAGKIFGIPVRGTHAHSWVMSFDNELEAFMEYARCMPNNCIFLVDTYDSIQGIKNAIVAAKWLRENGHELQGIRLDSGDLAYISSEARTMLDAAGFHSVQVMATNDLDENIINSLNQQGAKIDAYGIGTKLVTAYDQPALGGVYKLGAVRSPGKKWQYKLKLSEQQLKISNPGILQVRRFSSDGTYVADAIYDEETKFNGNAIIVDPIDVTRRKVIPSGSPGKDLLVPIFRKGKLVYKSPSIFEIKAHCQKDLASFHPTIRRNLNPHRYPAGLEQTLYDMKMDLILQARGIPTA